MASQQQIIDKIWQPPTSGNEYRAFWLIDDNGGDLMNEYEVALVEQAGKRRKIYPIATYTNLTACKSRITWINNYLARRDSEWLLSHSKGDTDGK